MNLEIISSNKSFGGWHKRYRHPASGLGWHKRYRHNASALGCEMNFAIYLPPQALTGQKVPVLYWLSGLTCTDENFMQKAGAQSIAAAILGLPDPLSQRIRTALHPNRTIVRAIVQQQNLLENPNIVKCTKK